MSYLSTFSLSVLVKSFSVLGTDYADIILSIISGGWGARGAGMTLMFGIIRCCIAVL